MKPIDFTNHSGGAKGADMTWDEIGRKYGVTDHCHWRPDDLKRLPEIKIKEMLAAVARAAKVLKRPSHFKGVELVHRNWLQVRYGKSIYAVAHIIPPGETDYRGFVNETGKEIVAGGTGWAVEMAIQAEKDVYVFDMSRNHWFYWSEIEKKFFECDIPELEEDFAGIGSTILTPEGVKAIEDVYIKTFNHVKEEKREKVL